MESRVKECLSRLKHEDEELVAPHHDHHHHFPTHRYNTELSAMASSMQLPGTSSVSIAREPITAADSDDREIEEHGEVDDQAPEAAAEEEGEVGKESDEEEGEEDEESHNSPNIIRADNYNLISSNCEVKHDYGDISRDSSSILVLNPCCSAAADYDQAAAIWGESTEVEVEVMATPEVEENSDVCAVCLEKLTQYYEEGVQALACRHAFHTVCIGPWLQRQPHACCPCCRAPIFPDNLPLPLHLSEHLLDVAEHDQYCAGVQSASNDIMGLLADMEAALERLGFRS